MKLMASYNSFAFEALYIYRGTDQNKTKTSSKKHALGHG